MAYSVVGYDFYLKKRNLDGTWAEDSVMRVVNNDTESTLDSSSTIPVDNDGNLAFTRDEASWFGMSRLVTGVFKECNV